MTLKESSNFDSCILQAQSILIVGMELQHQHHQHPHLLTLFGLP
uniref:Uncharacterized protein n=1 Tax=Rhizophora mucronata TaxID=61149 RepID=A0A2P2IUC5_RHIMU